MAGFNGGGLIKGPAVLRLCGPGGPKGKRRVFEDEWNSEESDTEEEDASNEESESESKGAGCKGRNFAPDAQGINMVKGDDDTAGKYLGARATKSSGIEDTCPLLKRLRLRKMTKTTCLVQIL